MTMASVSPSMYIFCGLAITAVLIIFAALTAGLPDSAEAMTAPDTSLAIDTGDTAWMLISTALVLLMTPGLAFFYGGLVTHRNIIATMMQSYVCMAVITLLWTVFTFSLAFGPDRGHVLGSPSAYAFYKNVGMSPDGRLAYTIPFTIYSLFQLMFAVITPALISGGFADRIKFSSWVLFVIVWHIIVYCPLAHSVWCPEGFLHLWGTLDFAGGTVVHMSAGYSSLVGSYLLGHGKDSGKREKANVAYVLLGTALLWFGWFGFNAGSALGANGAAAQAFLTTNIATSAGMITWMTLEAVMARRPSATGACAGAVVGLVVITPACGYVTVGGGFCMGVIGAIVCFLVQANFHLVDDALDVFPCHGVGGTVGIVLTGCFANSEVYPGVYNGLFYGGSTLFWRHIVTIFGVVTYVMVASFVIFKAIDLTLGLRVTDEDEVLGLDVSQHGESAHGLQIKLQEALQIQKEQTKALREDGVEA
jgi:Amt family ammonium transporter